LKKSFLNGASLAAELGISRGRVSQLTSDGVLIKHAAGYELSESVHRYLENKLRTINAGEAEKLLASRVKKLEAALERERLLLKKVNAEVVSSSEAKAVYTEQRRIAFEGFQELLDIAPDLEACGDDKGKVFEIIDRKAREILTALSKRPVMQPIDEE
jgi:biotin operon repressor